MSDYYLMTSVFLEIILVLLFFNVMKKMEDRGTRIVSLVLIGNIIVYILLDCLWTREYLEPVYNKGLFGVISVLFFVSNITLSYCWFRFAMVFLVDLRKKKVLNALTCIPWIINAAMIVMNLIGIDLIWSVGESDQRFERGAGYGFFSCLTLIYYFIPVAFILFMMITRRKKIGSNYVSSLWFSLIPAVGVYIWSYIIPENEYYPFQPFCFFTGMLIAYFFLIDRTIRTREEREMQYVEMAKALSNTYESIYYVNINDDTYIEFNRHNDFQSLDIELDGKDFFRSSIENLRLIGFPEDLEATCKFIDKRNILQATASGEAISTEYRLLIRGSLIFYRMKAVRTGDDHLIIAVENVNEEVLYKREEKET